MRSTDGVVVSQLRTSRRPKGLAARRRGMTSSDPQRFALRPTFPKGEGLRSAHRLRVTEQWADQRLAHHLQVTEQ